MNNIISYMTREMYHIIIEIISKFTVEKKVSVMPCPNTILPYALVQFTHCCPLWKHVLSKHKGVKYICN